MQHTKDKEAETQRYTEKLICRGEGMGGEHRGTEPETYKDVETETLHKLGNKDQGTQT